jgi:hypothetical protein
LVDMKNRAISFPRCCLLLMEIWQKHRDYNHKVVSCLVQFSVCLLSWRWASILSSELAARTSCNFVKLHDHAVIYWITNLACFREVFNELNPRALELSCLRDGRNDPLDMVSLSCHWFEILSPSFSDWAPHRVKSITNWFSRSLDFFIMFLTQSCY